MTEYQLSTADEQLLARLSLGEASAFEELVATYHHPMKRLARDIIGEAQAEDAVQEAWLSAIRSLHSFARRSSLKTWLLTIVSNEAKSRLRRTRTEQGKREISIDEDFDGVFDANRWAGDGHWARVPGMWHDNSPEALLNYDEFRKCLDKTLSKLPEDQKALLTLRDYQGLELEEICNIMNISASNSRVLIHRARLKVFAMVEHFEETGEC